MSTKKKRLPPVPPARQAALSVLHRTLHRKEDLQAALDTVLSVKDISSPDRGLATELTYGTLRYKGRIDYLLTTFLHRGKKLPPTLLLILETAAYELLFLDRVPDYATLTWAVDAAKASVSEKFAGLTNAVLRRVAALGPKAHEELFYTSRRADRAKVWSRFYSCPLWLVRLWLNAHGEKTCQRLLQATLVPPPVGLRFNWTRAAARDLHSRMSQEPNVLVSPQGVALPKGLPEGFADWEEQGLVSRQSLAAQESLHHLGARDWTYPVWDACAGRGGKSCFLAEQAEGEVYAGDVHTGRLNGLMLERQRLGLDNLHVLRAAADRPAPFKRVPPTILLDAPCSGLGVLSRRPDIKWKRSPKDVTALAALQARMIDNCWKELPSGGRLVYLTCTLSPPENEHQLERLLSTHTGARLDRSWRTPAVSPLSESFFGFACTKL